MATNRDKNKRGVSDRDKASSKTTAKKGSAESGRWDNSASARTSAIHRDTRTSRDSGVTATMEKKVPDKKTVRKEACAPKVETVDDETFNKALDYRLKAHASTWKELAKR